MKRREFIMLMASAAASCSIPLAANAQPTAQDLLETGDLPEMTLGSADAPVTVIEYASMTCGHCRTFHLETWPKFKEKYVDTGKVRFIVREFPFDPRASAAFMLARCSGDDKWYPTIDLLFRTQDRWARAPEGGEALKAVMGMTGMNAAAFEACLADEDLLAKITAVADRGKSFGVDSTPTFFVNGEMHKGALSIEQFSQIVDPLLAAVKG